MPKSRVRRKTAYTPPPEVRPVVRKRKPSPRWLAPLILVLFALGVAWLVVYYVSNSDAPVMRDLSPLANLGIGFGLIVAGFGLSTQWR